MLNNAVIAFLQLWLATLAFAAPIADEVTVTGAKPWHYGTGGGIIGSSFWSLIFLSGVLEVLQSNRPVSHKILWCLVVFLFPVVGMIIYYLFSNRKSHMRNSDYTPVP
ncbi:hypothetical protein QL093DRAFT_2125531 [Fusarium oxysporum]|nr:hypothetical protein QL093DRAFT_2125531 [Fusarium oxysporum]